tara:strand:+ start:468 stop:860 length:393 start_codon:yes stop_codon:yes gene_type:complete
VKNFFVHDAAGNILKTGSCPEGDLALQAKQGQTVVEGIANDATQIYVDGALQDKPEDSDEIKRESAMADLRVTRDHLLSCSDWTQVPDTPLGSEKRSEWQMYRQKLRDLPADYAHVTSIEDVVFPDEPAI